jgi:hypothetical protein
MVMAVPISILDPRAIAARSGRPELPGEVVHAEVRPVGSHLFGRDCQLERLDQ